MTIKSRYGECTFEQKGKKTCILDRENSHNCEAISSCAALAFHKSIIGLCELTSIENINTASLRLSKALSTYYCVYHLFTCCMLLDSAYDIIVPFDKSDGYARYGCKDSELNDPSETPEVWEQQKKHEQDLATMINHEQIKNHCKLLRAGALKQKSWQPFKQLLYKYFIEHMLMVK